MTGLDMFQHNEEMDDLSKSEPTPAGCGPLVNTFLCLSQYLVDTRRFNLLSMQENFSV